MTIRRLTFVPLAAVAALGLALILLGTFSAGHDAPNAHADVQGGPHMELDVDTTNGVCTTLDSTRTGAPTSGTYTIAVCLDESGGAPDAFDARVIWGGPLTVANPSAGAQAAPALNANPNANDGAGPNALGSAWDCTALGFAPPWGNDPLTPEQDARIVCNATNFAIPDAQLTASPGLLATITVTATGSGTGTFTIDPNSNVNSPVGNNILCSSVTCAGGSVAQGAGPVVTPTVTNTPAPPTPTTTPCVTGCATQTPINFITVTPTVTATGTPGGQATAPPAGGSPAPGGTTAAGGGAPPPAGGNQGSITPPNTGTGGNEGGGRSPWLWIGIGLVTAATFGAGTLIRRRAAR